MLFKKFYVIERLAFQSLTVSAAALVSSSSEDDDEQCLLTSTPVKKPTPIQAAQFVTLYSILSLTEFLN